MLHSRAQLSRPNPTDLAGPVALIIGNEGSGIPAEIARQVDSEITIPCPGPVESLNAAVAASVLLYEASQQRLSKPAGNPEHSSKKSIRGTGLAR